MYEVGLALACRLPTDVLLVRDDRDKFLFDVSTVPHMHVDFSDPHEARKVIHEEILARLREQSFLYDARVRTCLGQLSNQEVLILQGLLDLPINGVRGWDISGTVFSVYEAGLMHLLEKNLIQLMGLFEKGYPGYQLTPLGRIVAEITKSGLPRFRQSAVGRPDTSGAQNATT